MSLPKGNGVQNPLNLMLPIKSWLKLEELNVVLHLKTKAMFEAADAIGTLHFARFVNFKDHNQLGFFTAYDGSFEDYMHDFLKYLGPVFNTLNECIVDPSPSPIEKNVDAWLKKYSEIQDDGIGFYSAYPTRSVQDIKAAAGGGVGGDPKAIVQSPLTLVFDAKSPNHLSAMSQLIAQSLPTFYASADATGTVHFARFLTLGTKGLVLVADYDGSVDNLIQDFSAQMGPVFDEIFDDVAGAPATPVQKNVPAFTKWAHEHNLKPWTFYSAYPALTAKNIRAKAKVAAGRQ